MPGKTANLLPVTERLLRALGERLRIARLRRRLPAKQVAERAGMTVPTLRAIEHGSASATLGAYASVLQVLQLEIGLELVAQDDPLGRRLQDKALTAPLTARRSRAPRVSGPAHTDLHLTTLRPTGGRHARVRARRSSSSRTTKPRSTIPKCWTSGSTRASHSLPGVSFHRRARPISEPSSIRHRIAGAAC